MEPVYVLRNNRHMLSLPCKLRKVQVCRIRLCRRVQHFRLIKLIKQVCMLRKEAVTYYFLGSYIKSAVLIVKPVRRPKIRYTRRHTYSGSGKYADIFTFIYYLLQFFNFIQIHKHQPTSISSYSLVPIPISAAASTVWMPCFSSMRSIR